MPATFSSSVHPKASGIFASIFSMKIPYPVVGSPMRTCVTAPTRRPFCRIGEPDIPCTMPPVRASRSGSVTVTVKHFDPFASRLTLEIFMSY